LSTIFVIRHAEKPDGAVNGIDASGAADPESLTVQGWQRAGALAVFFGSQQGLPAPNQIYASDPHKEKAAGQDKVGSKSQRPVETVTPLAARLNQTINQTHAKGDEAQLAADVVQLHGITLICWQHEAIPRIATLIMGSPTGIPDPWPSDRFDVVWCFERSAESGPWTFTQVCQCVLAGDRSTPIG